MLTRSLDQVRDTLLTFSKQISSFIFLAIYESTKIMSSPRHTTMAPPSALGALALVPLEIRQMIYALALSYSPSIAQTSKELREETRFALQKHGIYRMHSFFERAPPYGAIMTHIVTPHGRLQSPLCFLSPPLISSSTLPIVQNLQITIEVVKPYRGYGLRKVCTLPKNFLFELLKRSI